MNSAAPEQITGQVAGQVAGQAGAVGYAPAPPETPAGEPPRAWFRQVMADTFARAGARAGAAWIAVLVFLAVFAPFLASSHPILMKRDGRWGSPMLRHLTPADVTLLASAAAGCALAARRRMPAGRKLAGFAGAVAAALLLAVAFVRPPQVVVFSQYREDLASGKIQSAVFTLIPFSPNDRLRDQGDRAHRPPDARHWMGTEDGGADVLSRMIHASRISLSIGFISTGIAVLIGCFVGGLMGYYSGRVDILGMRLIEIFSAIPTLFLLIIFVAVFPRNLYLMMVIIGLTSWVGYARFIRAEFLKLRQQDFVQAAVAGGLRLRSVLFRHMLPNAIAPVLVSASFGVAGAIVAEATLSFLGLGLIDDPSWGQLLNQAIGAGGSFYWWIAFYPGLAIFLTVFAYNLVGESLRDALDPKLR